MTKPRIVVAEHRPFTRELLDQILTPTCDVVALVDDGQSAVEATAELEPDVVVIDTMIPVMDSLTAAKLMKTRSPAVKVVFLSGHQNPDNIEEVLRAGADGYVLKEYMAVDLVEAIRVVFVGGTFRSRGLRPGQTPG